MAMTVLMLVTIFVLWDAAWRLLGVRPLFPWQLKDMSKRELKDAVFLDVRTAVEYRWFHIPGARNMPELLHNPDAFHAEQKDRPIVVVCMTGHRSPPVAYRLKKMGYTNVYNLTWGMLGRMVYRAVNGGGTVNG